MVQRLQQCATAWRKASTHKPWLIVQPWEVCLKKLTRWLSFVSYPMLPPQGARLPRHATDVGRRLPSSTLPPPTSRPYANHRASNRNDSGPTYSPGYIPVSGWEDDPHSIDCRWYSPQSDSTFDTPQWQKRKAVRGDNSQQTHLPLRPTPEAYDFTSSPLHSETRQEVCMVRSLSLAHWPPLRRKDDNSLLTAVSSLR